MVAASTIVEGLGRALAIRVGLVSVGVLAPGSVHYMSRNPAAGVKLPKLPKSAKRFLSPDQVWALADAAAAYPFPTSAHSTALWCCCWPTPAYVGPRQRLRVKRLDLLRHRVTVAETLGEVRGHLTWGTPKNHQARDVYLPPQLVDLLAGVVAGKDPGDLVFRTWRGPLRNLN